MTISLGQAQARLDDAARHAPALAAVAHMFRHPRATMKTTLAVDRDDGARAFFDAWHSRYGEARPAGSHLMLDPAATLEEVEALALLATLQGAVLDLAPCGGAGAIRADPALLSSGELRQLRRGFAERLCPWTSDGGGRPAARSAFRLLETLGREFGVAPGAHVAILGFGRAGRQLARLLDAAGYRIVAASDSKATLHAPDGLHAGKLIAAKEAGVLDAMSATRGVAVLDSAAIPEIPCELLVCAGGRGLADPAVARSLPAQAILELACGAVAPEVEAALDARGIAVLPDILASGGAAAARHLERMLDGGVGSWTPEQFDAWLAPRVEAAARAAWDIARKRGLGLRAGAHLLALDRLQGEARAAAEPAAAMP